MVSFVCVERDQAPRPMAMCEPTIVVKRLKLTDGCVDEACIRSREDHIVSVYDQKQSKTEIEG